MLIAQLTDLHIKARGMAAYRVAETNMLTERAFRAVARLDPMPDVVVISGDLTDNGLAGEYEVLKGLLARYLRVPVYLIPGNHDRREVLREVMHGAPGVGTDPMFVQYAVEGLPVRLVMLDTVVPGAGHGELCSARLDFLERTLSAAPDRATMVVMHHPPFVCGIGHMDAISLRDSSAFAEVIGRHRQVQRIVCGHHHRPVFAQLKQAIVSIAPSVAHQVELALAPGTPGAFLMEPPAYHLHWWDGSALVTHMAYVEEFPGPYPFVTDPDYPGKAA